MRITQSKILLLAKVAIAVFPALLLFFAILRWLDRPFFNSFFGETGPVECGTFGFMLAAAIISVVIFIQVYRRFGVIQWFYILFFLFAFYSAMEEISWGQSLFQFDSPDYFLEANIQRETNTHNIIFDKPGRLHTRDVAGLVAILYGVVLPLFSQQSRTRKVVRKTGVIVPPLWLIFGFLVGAILTLYDIPTGTEEEIGEFALSMGFFAIVIGDYLNVRGAQTLAALNDAREEANSAEFLLTSFREKFPPFAQQLIIHLGGVLAILMGLHIVSWYLPGGFFRWMFFPGPRFTIGSLYLLINAWVISLTAIAIVLVSQKWQRLAWVAIAVVFAVAGLADYTMPFSSEQVRRTFVAVVLGIGVLFILYCSRSERRSLAWFMATGSALVMIGYASNINDYQKNQNLFDNILGMMGISILLVGCLMYARERMNDGRWRWHKRTLVVGLGVLAFVGVSIYGILPLLENHFLATPVQVHYVDGDLSLLGYRLNAEHIAPGDVAEITLYWRANRAIALDYGLSLHLLTQPDIHSVASTNLPIIADYPTGSWLPGFIVKQTVRIPVPDDLPAPASYGIQLSLWRTDNIRTVAYTDLGDLQMLTPDTFILKYVSVLPTAVPDVPANQIVYPFANGIILEGYTLPEQISTGETLPIQLWWRADAAVTNKYVQFLHLLHEESGEYTVLDRPPFAGRFPTVDWFAGIAVHDEWDIVLPDDLPAGKYQIYTGLIEPINAARLPVTLESAQVQDDRINLGTIQVQ